MAICGASHQRYLRSYNKMFKKKSDNIYIFAYMNTRPEIKFKKLEIAPESKGIGKFIKSQHLRKSLIYILIGALAGFGFFYFTEAQQMHAWALSDSLSSIFIGAFLGFFITNSPCARNRC
ncbi:MAG: hypothetical protein EA393_11335 [Bacteroidetes bacterium]|nr:MAG: hypothetical protein EA393_11335 [Bacteroidota bacterium]